VEVNAIIADTKKTKNKKRRKEALNEK